MGKKLKKFAGTIRGTDVVWPKNIVGSSETPYLQRNICAITLHRLNNILLSVCS